ncbi:hypothetical protein ACQI4L_13735 [Mycolicibacterium litorale]|uniref:hypothetical protein n=1 Tax=Mycolicibacterium litorale TaxID=758802 RepID=UPI003CEEBAB0
MASSVVIERISAASLIALGLGIACAAPVSADPGQPEPPAPLPAPVSMPFAGTPAAPATAACRRFESVVRVSAAHYNNFAYSIAGNGAHVDYQDPTVVGDNTDGRTALRKAAGEAMDAASAPGLQPDIAHPLRSWSWHAAKLVLIMGLRGDGDTLNTAATELNAAAETAQMACVKAGVQPASSRR